MARLPIAKLLGTKSDRALAREYGLTHVAVWRMRQAAGIPPYVARPTDNNPGNKTSSRGHRRPGVRTHDMTPALAALLQSVRRFLAAHKLPPCLANPYSLTRLCADTGISKTRMSRYLDGTYVPGAATVAKIQHWLDNARRDADRRGYGA